MWNLWAAIDQRIPRTLSQAMREGILVTPLLIRHCAPLRWSDLTHLVIPALRSFGLEPTLHLVDFGPLPVGPIPAHSGLFAAFQLSEPPRTIPVSDEYLNTDDSTQFTDPEILRYAVVRRDRPMSNRTVWQLNPEESWQYSPSCGADSTWAILTVHKAHRTGYRGANVTQALLRFNAFADSNSERSITIQDTLQAQRAATFLMECAGKQANPSATRLRRSADAFGSMYIDEGLHHLRESVLIKIGLPTPIRRGLLRPITEPLSDMERCELIYLARAGTPELKVMAIRRLAPTCSYKDVFFTLEQSRKSTHPWVRSAAAHCLTNHFPSGASLRRIGSRIHLPTATSINLQTQ